MQPSEVKSPGSQFQEVLAQEAQKGKLVMDSMSGLNAKENNDTLVDVLDNSNLVSDCLVVKNVPKPGKNADKENLHCHSSNTFSALQVIDNDEAILLEENDGHDDDVENVFTEGLIENKTTVDEVQKEENSSSEQQQLVVFEPFCMKM
ncbi:OLC1v1013335C1 [Oldenlandia corymbosa var. corymbosa]|uniref:OLC1v1013335C1 n=1 Tax=Oldenlandia corymbosa var. corymbosa TaxID=529605 RepID=A0AAV1DYB7_OLDCO|nr:OLC1v1013335C1 [Oldenlandia corymbosa var. corymbosa]